MRTLLLTCSLVLTLSSCTIDGDELVAADDVASIPADEGAWARQIGGGLRGSDMGAVHRDASHPLLHIHQVCESS
jgi:hypothetical protein